MAIYIGCVIVSVIGISLVNGALLIASDSAGGVLAVIFAIMIVFVLLAIDIINHGVFTSKVQKTRGCKYI